MTRRQQNARVKQILREHLIAFKSVTYGRGTAYHWLHINTPRKVPDDVQAYVEADLINEKLCGSYFSDCGPGDSWSACVLWETQ